MDPKIADKLIVLNSEFYQTFASYFSATRMRLQPGVVRILDDTSSDANILDLGCGNGELARELIHRGHRGLYVGIDFSAELLDLAQRGVAGHSNFHFSQANIADPNWHSKLAIRHSQFTMVTAFAALHHIPGRGRHIKILEIVCKILKSEQGVSGVEGRFIHSNWQFLNSEKLRARIQPWSEIGLTDADVDSGDYLLDWRQGGRGLRYVHHFSEEELISLAEEAGFEIIDSFYSDGEGGNLGLYQIWEPKRDT